MILTHSHPPVAILVQNEVDPEDMSQRARSRSRFLDRSDWVDVPPIFVSSPTSSCSDNCTPDEANSESKRVPLVSGAQAQTDQIAIASPSLPVDARARTVTPRDIIVGQSRSSNAAESSAGTSVIKEWLDPSMHLRLASKVPPPFLSGVRTNLPQTGVVRDSVLSSSVEISGLSSWTRVHGASPSSTGSIGQADALDSSLGAVTAPSSPEAPDLPKTPWMGPSEDPKWRDDWETFRLGVVLGRQPYSAAPLET